MIVLVDWRMFCSLDDEAAKYYRANWEKAGIKWSPPILQRNQVRLRTSLVEIPKHLKMSALNEVFFPEYPEHVASSRHGKTIEKVHVYELDTRRSCFFEQTD